MVNEVDLEFDGEFEFDRPYKAGLASDVLTLHLNLLECY